MILFDYIIHLHNIYVSSDKSSKYIELYGCYIVDLWFWRQKNLKISIFSSNI